MTPPDLSIIIPVGNDPRITATLDSICKSIYTCTLEVVLVNNNCHANVLEALRPYEMFLSLKIIEDTSLHIGALRNKAIEAANSELFYFIDSDCIMEPVALQRAYELSRTYPVIRGYIHFFGDSKLAQLDAKLRRARYDSDLTFAYCPNLIVRKDIFKKVGLFREEYHYGSDGEFARRLRFRGVPVHYAPEIMATHQGPTSNKRIIETWIRYGEGRYKRLKTAAFRERVKGLFYPNLFDKKESMSYNGVVALCLASRWYGWIKTDATERFKKCI